jgi:heptosyltransferase-1
MFLMKILLIKTSSLGDVLHTFPALTDLQQHFPKAEVTWVVEEAFASIPTWHPLVKKVIPIALRRWRKHLSRQTGSELKAFLHILRIEKYDYILDAQGLLKSAIVSRLARGPRYGLDRHSAREPLASFFYQHKIAVSTELHAILRLRHLFAKSLAYQFDPVQLAYGITLPLSPVNLNVPQPYVIFLHATTWETKLYPEVSWRGLVGLAIKQGYAVVLPWGNPEEKLRSERIAKDFPACEIPPKLNLSEVAGLLQGARGVIAVDTGLGHLAAALSVPTVSLYGPTNPARTGTIGKYQVHLAATFECAPCLQKQCTYRGESVVFPACFGSLAPAKVWERFLAVLQ